MKIAVGLLLAMFLVGTTITAIPVKAAFVGTIKVGVIGPQGLPHWTPAGMWDGAEMAAEEINSAGGVILPDGAYSITLAAGNEYAVPTPNPVAAAEETERLITDEGCQFLIGGFRTECVSAMIPVAMGYDVPFLIDGASTNELISDTVGKDYPTYKYLFRVMPTNSTVLVRTLMAYIQFLVGNNLLPKYGYVHPGMPPTRPQVDVAVITEALKWADLIHYMLTNPAIYPLYMGLYVNVTYSGRIPDGETNCQSWLQGVINGKARVMVHVFSGSTGVPLIKQWKEMDVRALPVGINVMGQRQDHWTSTAGGCEGEVFLDTCGTRTPVVPATTVFWDNFVARTAEGYWPIYTAFGAYSGLYILKDAIESAGTLNADAVVTALENTHTHAGDPGLITAQHFKFTAIHDIYSNVNDLSYLWPTGYSRPLLVQWQAGRKEVVSPVDKDYARQTGLIRSMYPYPTDVTQNKQLLGEDQAMVTYAFGSIPGDARWMWLADVDGSRVVTTADLSSVTWDYFKKVKPPPPGYLVYGNEAGWLQY